MSLSAWLRPLMPESGTDGTKVRPTNEGDLVTIVDQNPTGKPKTFWDALDFSSLGERLIDGVGEFATAAVQSEIDQLQFGAEKAPDSTGDISDQPGLNAPVNPPQQGFFEKYKMPLMVGGGLLAAIVIAKKL